MQRALTETIVWCAVPVASLCCAANASAAVLTAQQAERVQDLTETLAEERGMERVTAFELVYVALCAERKGEGKAEDLLPSLAEHADPEALLERLSEEEFTTMLAALDELGLTEEAEKSALWDAVMMRLVRMEQAAASEGSAAGAAGSAQGQLRSYWAEKAWDYGKRRGELMPSAWWLQHLDSGRPDTEPMGMFTPPPGAGVSAYGEKPVVAPQRGTTPAPLTLSPLSFSAAPLTLSAPVSAPSAGASAAGFAAPSFGGGGSASAPIANAPLPKAEETANKPSADTAEDEKNEGDKELAEKETTEGSEKEDEFALAASARPRLMMMRMATAPMLLAEEPEAQDIAVAEGTSQSVVKETEASSVTLEKNATLYVADALSLSGTMTVAEGSRLVVKDGGVVTLGAYQDYSENPTENKKTALLFNALLNSTTTEGSGRVEIDSVSVQFGDGNWYNLANDEGVNAVFAAHYEIARDLQLQNFAQGFYAKKPSLWVVAPTGSVHVGGELKLSSYQQLVMRGGELVVDGTTHLGHALGSQYASKLDISAGSVTLHQVTGETAGASAITMSGGELTFKCEGDVFINPIEKVSLTGGTLIAEGNNWTLNHNATLGDVTLRTDADHAITLGGAGKTETLAGDMALAAGANAVLSGTYAGTGAIQLGEGASLVLGADFGTADTASVGLAGTGSVQVNWAGTPSGITNGFATSYDVIYRPADMQGELNLEQASQLTWKDADGNVMSKVSFKDGSLTAHVQADPTVYHIVTSGHTAVYDTEGNAAGASAFRLYNDGKLFIGKGYSVSADQVRQNGHTLTLQGSGDYVLDAYTLPQNTRFEADGEKKWTGAVVISGTVSTDTKILDLGALYQRGSTIAMNGFDGISGEWNGGTLTADIRMDAQADGSPAWRWNSGSTYQATTAAFSGAWKGAGDFVLGASGGKGWRQNFTYSGDISGWTGRFLVESGTTDVTLKGDAEDVYATFDQGTGTLNLKVDTNADFHADAVVNSLTVSGSNKVTLERGTEMHVTNALPSGTLMQQTLQNTYFSHVSGEGTLFLNFGDSTYDQMSITKNTTVTPDVNVVFTGTGDKQDLAIAMWDATSGGLNLDHTFLVADEITLQWGAGLSVGQTTQGAGSLVLNKLHLGHWNNANNPARVNLSGGSMMLGQIDISSSHRNTFTMTGGVLEITSSGNAVSKTAEGADNTEFTLSGGALRADGTKWVWNHDAVIGKADGSSSLAVETLNGGAVTIGAQGITTTLANTIDNHGALTLDGIVNITMGASDKANGYVDQDGNFGMSVGFAATLQMPGAATYQVVTGNAASLGENIVWQANGQSLNVVPADTANASNDSYYFDGYNLRLVNEVSEAAPERVGTVYYVGGRGGDYHFDKAENAAIVTGFDIANGTLHVDVSPEKEVSLALGYGTLALGDGVQLTVDKQQGWNMDAGASVVLGADAVLTLPGVEPETKADSYKVYQLLNNASGSGTIVFDGTLDVQFGNAGHNFVSPDSYNILEDNDTAKTGVNADIRTNVVVKGDMLIQNYRQGKDHPDVGSWWKVSEGGSLSVQGDLESSSYQKVSVDGGALTVGGTYKIGHEAGGEYEGDLELTSGNLSVGSFETIHEGTSTVHISGGTLTVTGKDKTAFANTFRKVSAHDATFEGKWTWNHDAVIGNLTVAAGSAITLGTAETEITLESPLAANNGSLMLNGAFVVNMEATEGGDVYGTETTGYTKDGDGYLKNLGDVYTLVNEGNDATLGKDIVFTLNGEVLRAGDFEWNGKSILLNATEAGTVFYLNTRKGYTYTDSDTRTTAFELANAGATLRLERELSALTGIHATAGGTVSLGEGVRMESELLQAENTVAMAGQGTYVLQSNSLMAHPETNKVSFTDPAWAGTAELSGLLGSEGTLNSLGNAASWVEMKGVFGADAADTLDVNVKLTDDRGEAAWIYTGDGHAVAINGDWAGDGTFIFAPVGGASQELRYTGNISEWTGVLSASGGTAQLVFAENAGEIAADIRQDGGKVEITAETDTHFTGIAAASSLRAQNGHIVLDHAESAALQAIYAMGGDVTLKGLETAASITLDELVLADGKTLRTETEAAAGGQAPETPDTEAHIVITGEGTQLTAGVASGVVASLSLGDGARVSVADRTDGLRVQGSLTMDAGSGIILDSAMLHTLRQTGELVLFSGVEQLVLGNQATVEPITMADRVDATSFIRGLMENLPAENAKANYVVTYTGGADGGVVSIRDTSVPEPAPACFALTALAAALFRRRRA